MIQGSDFYKWAKIFGLVGQQAAITLPNAFATPVGDIDATYNNGSSGGGATLTMNFNGAFTADGVFPTINDGILIQFQTNEAHNGYYILTQVGDASHPAILTRSPLFDGSSGGQIIQGSLVTVTNGDVYGGRTFTETAAGPFIVGVSPISFAVFAGLSAGTGLTIIGGVVSIAATGVVAGSYGNASKTVSYTVNAQGQLTASAQQDINITASQVSDFNTAAAAAAPVQSVAGKVGTVTLNHNDITDFNTAAAAAAPVQSVAGKVGAVTLALTDITGLVTALNNTQPLNSLLSSISALDNTEGLILQVNATTASKFKPTANKVPYGDGLGSFSESAVGLNGQVYIGATGGPPAFATLASADGSITYTTGANTLNIAGTQATTTQKGSVTLATGAEVTTGSDAAKVVTPATLTTKLGVQTLNGIIIGGGAGTNLGVIALSGVAGKVLTESASGPAAFQSLGVNSGLTAKSVVLSQGNSAFTALGAMTNGQLIIGSTGNNPVLATPINGVNTTWVFGPGTIQVNADFSGSYGTTITGNKTFAAADNGKIFLINVNSGAAPILTMPNQSGGSGSLGWEVTLVNVGTVDAIVNHQSGDVLDGPSYVVGPSTDMIVKLDQIVGGVNYYATYGGTRFKAFNRSVFFNGAVGNSTPSINLGASDDAVLLRIWANAISGTGNVSANISGVTITGSALALNAGTYLMAALTANNTIRQGGYMQTPFSSTSSLTGVCLTVDGYYRSY